MIKKIPMVSILTFSLLVFGNNVIAGNDGTSTNHHNNRVYDGVRTTAADIDTRNSDWGWLGLLGLAGLARSRARNRNNNPERQR